MVLANFQALVCSFVIDISVLTPFLAPPTFIIDLVSNPC
jgi:hypothetical protein